MHGPFETLQAHPGVICSEGRGSVRGSGVAEPGCGNQAEGRQGSVSKSDAVGLLARISTEMSVDLRLPARRQMQVPFQLPSGAKCRGLLGRVMLGELVVEASTINETKTTRTFSLAG